MVRSALTVPEKAEIWRAYRAGASLRSISRTLGRTMEALRTLVAATGGRIPLVPRRSARWLALAEREEISRGIVAGDSCRVIGGRIRRAGSTVSREIARNGGRRRYRACQAEHPPAKAYVTRRIEVDGKTWREAIRALKRQLVRTVFRLLIEGSPSFETAA